MFTVFVSATSELKSLRDTIHSALIDAGVHAITQDNSLGQAPRDVHDQLAKDIEHSDIVIHVAGDHYGADANNQGASPFPEYPDFVCSWTQFEYYYAHQLGKDVYAFVLAPGNTPEQLRANWTEEDFALRQQLQHDHRQRVVSGKFDGTPVASAPRTLNDRREVRNSLDMLSRLAGVVRRGQQDWGGRKDKIALQLVDQTRELARLSDLSDSQQAVLERVLGSIEVDLAQTRRSGRRLAAILGAVLIPVLVIALGGGFFEYGCRIPGIHDLCLKNKLGNAATYEAQKYGERVMQEYMTEPDPSTFSVEARMGSDVLYVDIKNSSKSVYSQSYFVQVAEGSPTPLEISRTLEMQVPKKVRILKKNDDGEMVLVRDLSEEVVESLISTTISLWKTQAENGFPYWECSVGGCGIDELQGRQQLCHPAVSKFELTQVSNSERWFELDRTGCANPKPSSSRICADFRSLPFQIQSATDFKARFSFDDGRTAEYTVPFRFRLGSGQLDGANERLFWTPAVPIDDRNPPGYPPVLLVGFVADEGWTINSGLAACSGGGMSRQSRERWLIDHDGKGLMPAQELAHYIRFGPALSYGHERISKESEFGKIVASGEAVVAVALESAAGSRMGPYWYRFDAREPIKIESKRLLATLPGRMPQVRCVPSQPAFCRPDNDLAWIGAKSIEFGVTPGNLETTLQLSFSPEDYLASTCENDGDPCEPFHFLIPEGVGDIYFRVTNADGSVGDVARINLPWNQRKVEKASKSQDPSGP